ncbi:GumC family protein [Methylobacterium sp. HMF5984]|uniref:GumC family protein n=1 Tax=Methylobacterium sp. HMF5984 TaxID=3367370 RepID=UPI0038543416
MKINEIFASVWRRKYAFLITFIIVNSIGIAVLKNATRIFEAESLILVDFSRSIKSQSGSDIYSAGVQQERYLKSQIKIAQGEPVIIDAIKQIIIKETGDLNPIVKSGLNKSSSMTSKLVDLVWRPAWRRENDENIFAVQSALRVEPELNTDLLKIIYRNRDPERAAEFANQITRSFIERHISLSTNPLASEFFREREVAARNQLAKVSQELEKFSVQNKTYSVDGQRKLYLARRDKIASDLSETRSQIGKTSGELGSLKMQLASLKSKINLPPEIFGDSNFSGQSNTPTASSSFGGDPPLLHVKLYQESAQKIINLNADLAGLKLSEANQVRDVEQLNTELEKLASKSAEFSRLEREVDQYEANILLYNRKSADAQIENAWRSNERLSTMQVVQQATAPIRPVFPRAGMIVPLSIIIGIILGCAAAVCLELVANRARLSRSNSNAYLEPAVSR